MALDVKVKIDIAKPVGTVGSWYPLIYVVDDSVEVDVYGEYTGIAELVTAGYADTTDAYKAAQLMLSQNAAPDKFAVLKQKAFSAETFAKYLTKGWRQIIIPGAVDDTDLDIASYIETTDKMLFVTAQSKTYKVGDYDRVFCVYSSKEPNAAAAVVGATVGYAAGSFTYKNIIIKGVEPEEMSDADIEALHDNGIITILEKAGDIVTSEGITSSGEYADIIDSEDYITQDIAYSVQKTFNKNKKVAYTNAGISLLEAAVTGALVRAFNNGMIATDENGLPLYSVSFAMRNATTEGDRAERNYPYGKFTFSLAGAIHTADITGEITV